MLIDTHAHLNEPVFAERLPAVIARALSQGVTHCIVPAYDVASLERTRMLHAAYPAFIHPAYGIHPWFIEEGFDTAALVPYLEKGDAIAIGEIGLDYGFGEIPPEVQKTVLIRQVEMSIEYQLPVIVHCRKAFDELYAIMSEYRNEVRGVMHSFSGSLEWLHRFVDLGWYISFSGSVTRKSARKYHRNAQAVPADRYLLETDAPSIATETTVASDVEPDHLIEVAEKMAELRGETMEQIISDSSANARRLFRFPGDSPS